MRESSVRACLLRARRLLLRLLLLSPQLRGRLVLLPKEGVAVLLLVPVLAVERIQELSLGGNNGGVGREPQGQESESARSGGAARKGGERCAAAAP